MSFRNFERNRLRNGPAAHAEDSQPNESINKRQAAPTLIIPTKQPRFTDSKRGFRGGRGWARGGYYATAGHPINPPPRNPVHSVPRPPAQIINSGSKRVPTADPDAFSRQPFRRDSAEAVVIRPNSYYEQRTRVPATTSTSTPTSGGFNADVHSRNATKGQPTPMPTSSGLNAYPTHTVNPARTTALPTSRVSDSPPPMKRQRIEPPVRVKVEEPLAVLPPRVDSPPRPPSSHSPVRVKQEHRTPSPPPTRPFATSGSKRYWPVPEDCKRAFNPQFDANRREWLGHECDILKDLGLKIVKYFFR